MARTQRFAFVLRIWIEDEISVTPPHTQLRGSLHAVNTEKVYYFDSLDKLSDVLREITDWRIHIEKLSDKDESEMSRPE